MASVNLAGPDPQGHPRLYITHIPSSEIEEWKARRIRSRTDVRGGLGRTEGTGIPKSLISRAGSAVTDVVSCFGGARA